MNTDELDTIVAPATPLGRSALAVVRLDGPAAGRIALFLSGRESLPPPRSATVVGLAHSGHPLDQAVMVVYRAPASFTGNDLVELTLHGNPPLVTRVISAAVELGARVAEPGEFSERAVLNGKLDLLQAESIHDLIASRTALQARLALSTLEGGLSAVADGLRGLLLRVISRLEAALDFAEEGYEFIERSEAERLIVESIESADRLLSTYRRGRATSEGLSAVILGRPNSGKSTLLNYLCGSDRAIVTEIPGTTRDLLRETVEVGGLPVTFIDTAGLRETVDLVEGIGVGRAREAATHADLVLYLIDASTGEELLDRAERGRLQGEVLVVYTKTDLALAPEGEMGISVREGFGLAAFMSRLDAAVRERFAVTEGTPSLVNERQRIAVVECRDALEAALESLREGSNEEIVVVDLYRAANALGILTGAISREDVLAEIFAKFCIGK